MLSDTHGRHESVVVPQCDILVHCGDFSTFGKAADIVNFANWFEQQPGIKVAVAGNHDWLFEKQPDAARFIFASRGIQYLQDQVIDICGAKFYGSPWQPWFNNWAFNLTRNSEELRQKWAAIPDDTDVLISHCPPRGVLDPDLWGNPTGCELLRERVDVIKPKIHTFGHLHSGAGMFRTENTIFVNAAIVGEDYRVVNEPTVVDL